MSVTRRIRGIELPQLNGIIAPQIELFGDWELTRRMLLTLDDTLTAALHKANKEAAKRLRRTVRRNIRESGGSIGWAPLKPETKKLKKRRGQDPDRILFATGLYYRSITIWNKGTNYYVGVKRGIRHRGMNKTVGEIARLHESGTSHIPARPLWAPSYRQMGGGRRVKNLLIWHIRNQIYLKYGVRPKMSL